MLNVDIHSAVLIFMFTDTIITFVMVLLWFQNRKHFTGVLHWVINFLFQTIALALIGMRGNIPDWLSMVFSNSLVICGNMLALIGIEKFVGIKGRHIHNYILLITFVFVHAWFALVKPDLPVRNLNLSTAFLLISLQICWLIFVRLKGEIRRLTINIGTIFLIYCLVNSARIVNFFISDHPENDYFKPNGFESSVLIFYQMLFILLAYSLSLMFNKRLIKDVENGTESLKESQALLQAAMDHSPSGIAIADAPSGKLRYVNKAGLLIPAKSEEEIVKDIDINKYVASWNIKHHDGTPYMPDEVPLARAVMFGESVSKEFIISRDESDNRIVLANAAPILDESGKVKAGIVVFQDITEYKRAEEKLRQQFFTLKGLNDSTNSPIFSVDTNYCYTSFNTTHASVMKGIYNAEIETGRSLLEYMSVETDRVAAKKNIDRALNGEYFVEEVYSGDDLLSGVYFEVAHNPILNDKAEVIGVAVLAKDLTLRKRMEVELNNRISELEKFNKIMVGREIRMIELKNEINELCGKLGLPDRYKPKEANGNGS